jgi:hypothetical protein
MQELDPRVRIRPPLGLLYRPARNELQRVVRQRPLHDLGFVPRCAHPHVALFVGGEDHRQCLEVNGLDDGVRRRRQKTVDVVRAMGFDFAAVVRTWL